MYTTRASNTTTSRRIRTLLRKQQGRTRAILYVDHSFRLLDTKGTQAEFMSNFQYEAVKYGCIALNDGTYLNLYAAPDYTTDPDYVLNEGASLLRMNETYVDVCDDEYYDKCVFGNVLFQRVDEDGTELGLDADTLIDAFVQYNVKIPKRCS